MSLSTMPEDVMRIIIARTHIPREALRAIWPRLVKYAPNEKSNILSIYKRHLTLLEANPHPWFYAFVLKRKIVPMTRVMNLAIDANCAPFIDWLFKTKTDMDRSRILRTIVLNDNAEMFAHFFPRVDGRWRSAMIHDLESRNEQIIKRCREDIRLFIYAPNNSRDGLPRIAAIFPDYCADCGFMCSKRAEFARLEMYKLKMFSYLANWNLPRDDILSMIHARNVDALQFLATKFDIRGDPIIAKKLEYLMLTDINRELAAWLHEFNIRAQYVGYITRETREILREFNIEFELIPQYTPVELWCELTNFAPARVMEAAFQVPSYMLTEEFFADLAHYYGKYVDIDDFYLHMWYESGNMWFAACQFVKAAYKYFEFRDINKKIAILVENSYYDDAIEICDYLGLEYPS
jgi:hypothetical protein